MTLSNMTKYFRQSLLDSENLSPSDSDVLPAIGEAKQTSPKKLPFVVLEKQVWLEGRVHVSFAKGLLGDKKTTEITMFPRVDLSQKRQQKPRVLLPLVVFAELNQQGELKPTQKAPLIPREWLAPNQGVHQPFAELAMLEHFYAKNPFEGIETWEQLQAYCGAMLCAVTQVAKADLYALAIHQDYAPSEHVLIQVEQDISGASKNIIGLLDTMLKDEAFPKLYARFCSFSSPKITPFRDLTLAPNMYGVKSCNHTFHHPSSL